MKKSLLGFLIALLAFTVGVFAASVFRVEPKSVFVPAVAKVRIEEFNNEEIPLSEVEQLENTEEIEAIDNSRDTNAWYSLDDYGKMSEVAMIKFYLTYYNDDGTESDKPILYSGVFTNLSEDVYEGFAESVWTSYENGKLKFKTKKLKGIEYRFEGVFHKNKKMGENGEKLLRGTLQKFVKGKKVAEVSGNFAFYEPYCLS